MMQHDKPWDGMPAFETYTNELQGELQASADKFAKWNGSAVGPIMEAPSKTTHMKDLINLI